MKIIKILIQIWNKLPDIVRECIKVLEKENTFTFKKELEELEKTNPKSLLTP